MSRKTWYWIRRSRWFGVGVAACVGAVIISSCVLSVYLQRWEFGRRVIVGMSIDDVDRIAGQPQRILKAGEVLDRWGTTHEQPVAEEVWIYSLWPRSAHRAVVKFQHGKVEEVEFEYN